MQKRLNILIKKLILDMICYLFMLQWVRTQSQRLLKNTACVTLSIRSILFVIDECNAFQIAFSVIIKSGR